MSSARAAVDVGSNSVRLLVHDAHGNRVTREMTVTRLGTGVDRTGRLDDDALRRTLDTIADYRRIWQSHGVNGQVRIAATSAVRDAADRDRFFDGVRAVAGVEAEVLSGAEEAALAFLGATGAVEVARPTAVIDIGGGSTEVVVGAGRGAQASASVQLGCVRLTERHLHDDPPGPDQLAAARAMVDERLIEVDRRLAEAGFDARDAAALVAVAGTATTLGALHLGLATYEESAIHGVAIPTAALTALTARLLTMSASERAALGPMQPGRADVIHGGALVLAMAAERYGIDAVVVSEADSLDGLVASLATSAEGDAGVGGAR